MWLHDYEYTIVFTLTLATKAVAGPTGDNSQSVEWDARLERHDGRDGEPRSDVR